MPQRKGDIPQSREPMWDDKKLSAYWGISIGTLQHWRSDNSSDLLYCKLGRLVRYRIEDIEDFQNNSQFQGTGRRVMQPQEPNDGKQK
jgi:hypothetical protein